MKFNKYWFKPKKYGYGAQPYTWEGWFLTIAFILFIVYIIQPIKECTDIACIYNFKILAIIISTLVFFIIFVKKKTDGCWKWRWG